VRCDRSLKDEPILKKAGCFDEGILLRGGPETVFSESRQVLTKEACDHATQPFESNTHTSSFFLPGLSMIKAFS
jgi:hypothetical protein